MVNNSDATQALSKGFNPSFSNPIHDFEQQCLRVLRCTALALANSPGGFRFKAGTRPWLDALSHGPIGSLS